MEIEPKVVLLPPIDEPLTIDRKHAAEIFHLLNPSQIQANLAYIADLWGKIPDPPGFFTTSLTKDFLKTLYARYQALYMQYEPFMTNPEQFVPIEESLQRIPNSTTIEPTRRPPHVIQEQIRASAAESNETSPIIFLSPTHASTYSLVKAIREEHPDAKLGLVIFDEHIDVYATEEDLTAEATSSRQTRKSNFLWHLFHNRDIEASGIIGPTKSRERRIETGKGLKGPKRITLPKVYSEIKDMLTVITPDNVSKQKRLKRSIKKLMNFFQSRGVTNVIFSIDVDSLQVAPTGFTTAEYNPLLELVIFSALNFQKIDDLEKDSMTKRASYIQNAIDKPAQVPHLLASNVDVSLIHTISSLHDESGMLELSQVLDTIQEIKAQAAKYNIAIGIELQGHNVPGDITELSLPDYQGKTAEAVNQLVRALVA